jgi:hypothetical protein
VKDLAAVGIQILSHPLLCGPALMEQDSNRPDAAERLMKRIGNLASAGMIDSIRRKVQTGQEFTISSALRSCTRFQSTDPKDRIYGLLGIITDATVEELEPL